MWKKNKNMVVFALTFIRHGETAHNKDNVIQGQMDVPLSQTGLKQAELLGFYLQYQQYSHVYASDLTRAKQTAESIIYHNRSYKSTLLHDRRLRERKFGIVEGKSFKYLKEAAEKSNQKTEQYTPPGGETIQQVHERAVSFFQDLCAMVKERSNLDSSNYINRSSLTSLTSLPAESGKGGSQKRKWEIGEVMPKVEHPNDSQNKIIVTEASQKNDDFAIVTLKSEPELHIRHDRNVKNFEMPSCQLKKDMKSKQNTHSNGSEIKNQEQFSITFTDDIIRSQIMSHSNDLSNIECPNVSLSPLVDHNFINQSLFSNSLQENGRGDMSNERRLSVCSSSDDADSGPTLMANILVVSHGGWLRELFRHFVEDLECSVPGGKKQALRISPNAGLSKFTVSIEEHGGHPKIICLQIHDKEHLSAVAYPSSITNSEECAL